MEAQKMVKVKILKPVGPYMPGQEVEVDEETAGHLADGVKAMKMDDYAKKQAADAKDLPKMSVAEMQQKGLKNVTPSQEADAAVYRQAEQLALQGKPLASGEPLVTTGGVTPPTTVFPAMAKAGGHDSTVPADVGIKSKVEQKKADDKGDQKQPEKK